MRARISSRASRARRAPQGGIVATRLECAFLEGDALATWDALVDRVPNGTIFHSRRWTEIIAGAFARRARVLGVFRNGVLIAGTPLYERRTTGLVIANP